MQLIRSFEQENAALVGFGIRALLLTTEPEKGPIAQRLAGIGGRVEVADELFFGLEAALDDPRGYELLVIDCDTMGGIELGRRATAMLGETARSLPVILISRDCQRQVFPEQPVAPTELRAPLSAVSLRVGFEHALREKLARRLI